MSQVFAIREAGRSDVGKIYELILELAKYEKMLDDVTGTVGELENWLFGDNAAAKVILGCEGEDVVGFALYFTTFSTFLAKPGIYLEDLYVLPECRGKGYGKALIGELARIADEKGYGRLEWSVLDWNEPSIKFYESLGAKPNDGWTVYRVTEDGFGKVMGS